MARLLVKDCIIIPITGEVISEGVIAIEDDQLFYVGPARGLPPEWVADEVIEARDRVALPGLINAHTHAAMTLLRNFADDLPLKTWLEEKIWPQEAKLERQDIYWGTQLALLEMLRSGTTTFADMYFHMEAVAEAVIASGMRACLARGLIGYQDRLGLRLRSAEAFARQWQGAGEGRVTTMLGPHAPYTCPPEYLKKVMAAAERVGVGLHIHLAETRGEVEEMRRQYGRTPVELMESLGLFELPAVAAHCVHLTPLEIEILARRGVGVAHCPESNLKLGSGIAPVSEMLSKGVKVGIGTDSAASNNNLDMLEETRLAALLAKGLCQEPTLIPAARALQMATLNGAAALGLEDKIGSLEAGKKADVVLINLKQPHLYPVYDPQASLVYAARGSDVETVIVNGKVLMYKGEVRTIDEDKVMAEVSRCIEKFS
ncbi:MAG: 5-methylthioadenosine/S-adenosylhomocysteine deaminase [Clostridia bacterium]|nr:5-methylthioadenosine/S-adenosylhomocysteine deaminase [Clostridia bacterium]